MEQNKETRRPTHTIWQVIGDGDTARWNQVGAAWSHKDGKGFSLKLDAFPANGRMVVRERDEPKDQGGQP